MLVGVPDGMGAYLVNETTVRVVFQSESYGPMYGLESYPFIVNGATGGSFTGSHVMYVDYDRHSLADFMSTPMDSPAAPFVTGAGNLITSAMNLHGAPVGPRNRCTIPGHTHITPGPPQRSPTGLHY